MFYIEQCAVKTPLIKTNKGRHQTNFTSCNRANQTTVTYEFQSHNPCSTGLQPAKETTAKRCSVARCKISHVPGCMSHAPNMNGDVMSVSNNAYKAYIENPRESTTIIMWERTTRPIPDNAAQSALCTFRWRN